METNSNVIIKFDVFGNQLIFSESTERDEIIPIDKTELKNEILKEIPDFKSDLRKLKDEIVNNFYSLFSITKSYVGFKNRRLVSVSEGKDNNDVVIMKQVKKMLEDSIKENLRDKRSIDMEDIETKLLEYATKKELNEKIETLDEDIYNQMNDLFIPQVKKDIDLLKDETNNKFETIMSNENTLVNYLNDLKNRTLELMKDVIKNKLEVNDKFLEKLIQILEENGLNY